MLGVLPAPSQFTLWWNCFDVSWTSAEAGIAIDASFDADGRLLSIVTYPADKKGYVVIIG